MAVDQGVPMMSCLEVALDSSMEDGPDWPSAPLLRAAILATADHSSFDLVGEPGVSARAMCERNVDLPLAGCSKSSAEDLE